MDFTKASWRYSSPRRKLKAIMKMRPDRVNKLDLLHIAASDPDEDVRVAAARKLCSLGSIAAFLEDEVMGPLHYSSHLTDGPKFQLIHALLDALDDDDDALSDIAMNFDLIEYDMHEDQAPPEGAANRYMESSAIRVRAVRRICSEAMLYRIASHWETLPEEVVDAAVDGLCDEGLLRSIMDDRGVGIDLAIRAALRLDDSNFMMAVAFNRQLHDDTRLYIVDMYSKDRFLKTLAWIFLENPPTERAKLNSSGRLRLIADVPDEGARVRFYEAIALNETFPFDDRMEAIRKARELGGTRPLPELGEEARLASLEDHTELCPARHNGHRWVYNGIRRQELLDDVVQEEEEYICALCGKTAAGWIFRPHTFRPARKNPVEEDDALVSLLERETDESAISDTVAAISDLEKLLAVALTNANITTRKEALFEAYDLDRSILYRIDDECLLFWLGMYTYSDADLKYIIPKMTERHRQRAVAWKKRPAWRIPKHHRYTLLSDSSKARIAAVDEVSGDENLARLLEQESDHYAVRKIIAKIADIETLFRVAHADVGIETRAEAVIAAYEKDRSILEGITDEELLCILAVHVSDTEDLLSIIRRIENQDCLLAIGWRMFEKGSCAHWRVYLAALAKVTDQIRLSAFFTETAIRHLAFDDQCRSFLVALLNMIDDPIAQWFIVVNLPQEDFYNSYSNMAGENLLNPGLVWTEDSYPRAPDYAALFVALAGDRSLLERLAEYCTESRSAHRFCCEFERHCVMRTPPSDTARKLLQRIQSLEE